MSVADAAGEAAPPPATAEAGRYGAFVSYSRVDGDVARRLRAALTDRRIQAWLDVEGIVGGDPWRARITNAIEACSAFVFLVSPHSLRSTVCAWELDRAVELNKLIVAVDLCDVDERDLPPSLTAGGAIRLAPQRGGDPDVDGLAAALAEDLPWRERHTQIAVRGRRWAEAEHDPSLLIVGRDLRDAETWLGERGAHRSAPTAAHAEYVGSSRRAAVRRQRRRSLAALATLCVALVLAATALIARNGAVAGKREALSRTLAAQAIGVAERDAALATALSVEAARIEPTEDAKIALARVLPQLGESLGELRGNGSFVKSVAMSPDGATIASAGEDGTVRLSDVATRTTIGAPMRGHRGLVFSVAFDPAGTLLASGGEDRTVRLWDVASRRQVGAPMRAPRGRRTGIATVAFSPDGATVAAATLGGTVQLWDVRTRRMRGAPLGQAGTNPLLDLAYSPDGRRLATAAQGGTVRIWNVGARRVDGAPILGHVGDARAVAFSPDGRTLATGGADGVVGLWDVATHRLVGAPVLATLGSKVGVWSLAFAPGGRTLAITGQGSRLWHVATHKPLGPALEAEVQSITFDAAFSPDGRTLANSASIVRLWNVAPRPSDRAPVRTLPIVTPLPGLEAILFAGSIAYSADARSFAVVDGFGLVTVWDAAARRRRGARIAPPPGHRIITAAFRPDGRVLVTGGEDGAVRLWSVATRRQLGAPLRGHAGAVTGLAVSPDGRLVASGGNDGTVRLWSVAGGLRSGVVVGRHRGAKTTVSFDADGKLLASSGSDERVRLWDVAARRPLGRPLVTPGINQNVVAFSPRGSLLATGGADGLVRLWDPARRRAIGRPLRGPVGADAQLAFSADGATLASAGSDAAIRLWSVGRRVALGAPVRPRGSIYAIAFSPDGATLSSYGTDGVVRSWDRSLWSGGGAALRARACRAARRSLSRAEWTRYLPSEPYHETCPAP